MTLTVDEVKNIAHLARLGFSDEEIEGFTGNLSRIIDLVDQLDEAETDNVVPMAHPLHMNQPMRQDTVTESDQRDRYQENAPRTEAGLYLVPRVID
jgi:aspartyl-tRNA(Asn)/glutamyl-tRNA(Gln) amidotransferase subunit C